jgi:putrescine aminotransferase
MATLEVIRDEGLEERSQVRGEQLLAGLKEVQKRYSDLIVEARGMGLMIGVEFAMDEVGELTVAQMMKRGLCAAYTLNNPRVIRFEPPLIVNEEQVEFAWKTFGEALAETSEMLAALAS